MDSIPPAILAFDGADDVSTVANPHRIGYIPPYRINEGIDHAAQAELAKVYGVNSPLGKQYASGTRHVFGGYRNYGPLPASFDIAGQPGVTARVLAATGSRNRVLVTHWPYGASDTVRASFSTMDSILGRAYDDALRAYVNSLPIGRNRIEGEAWCFRLPVIGEMDVIVRKAWLAAGADVAAKEPVELRDMARASVLHTTDVLTKAALELGATPDEFGAGGVLTRWTMNQIQNPTFSGYDWWRDLTSVITDPAQRELVVGFTNPYFYHLSTYEPEDPRPVMRMHKALFQAAGIDRYVVSETTCGLGTREDHVTVVGRVYGQSQFIDWCVELLDEGTVEWLGYFHAPGGYMSDGAPLRGSPLKHLALAAERINLV